MKQSLRSIVVLGIALCITPAWADSGTVPGGSDAEDIVDDIEGPWSGTLGCIKDICNSIPHCSLSFVATSGPCLGSRTRVIISINTPSGTLSEAYNWEIVPACTGIGSIIEVGFQACPGNTGMADDCGDLDLVPPLLPGQTATFGEIKILARVVEPSSKSVPALPRLGVVVLGVVLIGAAVLFIVRRGS